MVAFLMLGKGCQTSPAITETRHDAMILSSDCVLWKNIIIFQDVTTQIRITTEIRFFLCGMNLTPCRFLLKDTTITTEVYSVSVRIFAGYEQLVFRCIHFVFKRETVWWRNLEVRVITTNRDSTVCIQVQLIGVLVTCSYP